jgi:branched-chain amino acid transport system substrate-binding protein
MDTTARITLLAAAVALIGCGEQKPAPKAEKAAAAPAAAAGLEVKIGHVGPLTGGIAHLGKDNENGARLAIDEANAAGIKIDGKAVKFTLVAEDDRADPRKAPRSPRSSLTPRSPASSATSTPAPPFQPRRSTTRRASR